MDAESEYNLNVGKHSNNKINNNILKSFGCVETGQIQDQGSL